MTHILPSNLLVIIPTLNERENISRLVPELLIGLKNASVLIVDDRSADGTRELVQQLQEINPQLFLLKRDSNPGYGHSVLDGLSWGLRQGFEDAVTMDADFSHDYHAIPGMLDIVKQNDIVIGSRYISGGAIDNWKWHRRLLSRFSNWYVRVILNISFHDATTGFVCYSRKALEALVHANPQSEGYAFLVESKYILLQSGFKIGEYPITFHERHEGTSKMSWKNIREAVWLPWRLARQFKDGLKFGRK